MVDHSTKDIFSRYDIAEMKLNFRKITTEPEGRKLERSCYRLWIWLGSWWPSWKLEWDSESSGVVSVGLARFLTWQTDSFRRRSNFNARIRKTTVILLTLVVGKLFRCLLFIKLHRKKIQQLLRCRTNRHTLCEWSATLKPASKVRIHDPSMHQLSSSSFKFLHSTNIQHQTLFQLWEIVSLARIGKKNWHRNFIDLTKIINRPG